MKLNELRRLIADLNSDSKKLSEQAEDKIIDVVSKTLKKFYAIYTHFSPIKDDVFDNDYRANGGFIKSIIKCNVNSIYVYYYESFRGDEYSAYIDVPYAWILDTEAELAKYYEVCKNKKIARLNDEIETAKKNIERVSQTLNEVNERTYEKFLESNNTNS